MSKLLNRLTVPLIVDYVIPNRLAAYYRVHSLLTSYSYGFDYYILTSVKLRARFNLSALSALNKVLHSLMTLN